MGWTMGDWLHRAGALIESWGLTGILAVAIGVITLLMVLFMPLKDVEHADDFAGITYATAMTAIGVICVIAVPQVWRSGEGALYSLFFCLIVGSLALVRFRMSGNEVKVVVKSANDEATAKAKK